MHAHVSVPTIITLIAITVVHHYVYLSVSALLLIMFLGEGYLQLTASRRGQDKRSRRRSAAIPPSQLSWGNAVRCGDMLQNVATRAHLNELWHHVRNLSALCESPICPDPVWKPEKYARGLLFGLNNLDLDMCSNIIAQESFQI